MDDPTVIGPKIRSRREALNLSRRQLATEAGVSESHIGKLENGKFRPSLTALRNIARRLQIPMPELIGEPDPASDEVDLQTLALALSAAMLLINRRPVSEEGQATWELAAALYNFIRRQEREGRPIRDCDQLVRLARDMQGLPLPRR